jgi:3-phenylpropionate/cinnamic acid dioxygenase small subunit
MTRERLPAEDRLDVAELIARHAWCVDTADVDGWVATFTTDGVFDLPGGRRYQGHDQLRAYMEAQVQAKPFPGQQHHVSQIVIEGAGSPCSVRSHLLSTQRMSTGATVIYGLGSYADTCVKVDGEWRFAKRIYRPWSGSLATEGS